MNLKTPTIGKFFRTLRFSEEKSLREVAKETKLSKATISRIENDKGEPYFYCVAALINYYKISNKTLQWILRLKGKPSHH